MRYFSSLRPALALAGLLWALTLPARQAAAQEYVITPYLVGLDNPHGLAFGPDGALYVTEAGRGGGGSGPSIVNGNGQTQFFGATGAVTRYLGGVQTRIATGLPSLAGADGTGATGPHDIAFDAAGNPFVLTGLGANPAVRSTDLAGVGGGFGQLALLNPDGTLTNIADISGYEAANNPDGGALDSNPFGLTAYAGGFLVADAGANALLNVTAGGAISTLAVFPNRANPLPFGPPTYQAVPTAVAVGPDGAFYVSQLTGFPFPAGGANIFRVPSGGGAPTEFLSGFTNVVDLAFGADGSLYVLSIDADSLIAGASSGALIRVAPGGARTTLVSQGLFMPTAMALGPDGAIYVSNNGVLPGAGQVVRVAAAAAVPEPGTMALLGAGVLPLAGAVTRRRRRA